MKKSTKWLLFIAGGFLFLGILLSLISFVFYRQDIKQVYTPLSSDFDAADAQTVSVKIYTADLLIRPSSDERVHLSYFSSPWVSFSVKTSNQPLVLEQQVIDRFSLHNIFFFFEKEPTVILELPSALKSTLDLSLTTGMLTIKDLPLLQEVKARVTTGDIHMERVNATRISLTSTTGSQALQEVTAPEVFLTTTTGSLCPDRLCSDKMTFSTTTGSIIGTLLGEEASYTIRSHTVTGHTNLPEYRERSIANYLTATTTTGSIDLSFLQQ